MIKPFILAILLSAILAGCKFTGGQLPILSILSTANGDTTYKKVPDFSFTNQHGQPFSKDDLKGKVYIADFFFISCPTICPVMTKNMKTIYDRHGQNPNFLLVSHSIDPRHDTVAALKAYADQLGVTNSNWQFLTGKKDDLYQVGYDFYVASISEDDSPGTGGYVHSGQFILVDDQGRIRGFYNGTDEKDVGRLMADLPILLK